MISSGCEISERWLAFTSMVLAPKLRQNRQGNVIVEVLLDVVPHLVLLPTGKSAAKELSGARSPAVEPRKLMHQNDAERFAVGPLPDDLPFGLRLELGGRLP